MTITIADGRGALWQWDTGRRVKITDGNGVKQVHYQNKCFGRSVDVDIDTDGTAIIPDELLQDWHTLTAYAYVTDDAGAYTMVQTDQMTLQTIQRQIGDLSDLTTEAKKNLVAAINEVAASCENMGFRVADGYIQYSTDGSTWQNLTAVADLKGADGITPHIGSNGNWYLGDTDTGVSAGGGTADAVQYTAQTLTDPQKLQARKNIDALGSVAPNIQNYMVITPPGQDAGIGVALSARGTSGNFTLDIADANESQPTKLMGVKTPTDAETHAAANVEYVKNKVAGATGGAVDEVMSNTSTNAVQNKVIKKYVDDSAAKKLDQETPIIKDGVTLDSGGYQLYAQLQSQSSATGDEVIELNLADDSPESTGIEVVISGLADFGDAEAAGMPNTAVSYSQLINYTKPIKLTYANGQVTGESPFEIYKAINRGRQITLSVPNLPDIIASKVRNENNTKSIVTFINTIVSGDAVNITEYTVTAERSGLTMNVKSHEIADGSEVSY